MQGKPGYRYGKCVVAKMGVVVLTITPGLARVGEQESFRCPREQRLAGHWIFGPRLTSAILQLCAAKQREAVRSKLFREEPALL